MELKKRSEFPEKELWDLTALYQDQEDFLRAIEKTREEINEFVRNYRATSTLLKTLKLPLQSLNKFRSNSATLVTTALCPKRRTLAMKLLRKLPKQGWILKLGPALNFPSLTMLW